MDEEEDNPGFFSSIFLKSPEISSDPMEFLSRSWSVSALELSQTAMQPLPMPAAPSDLAVDAIPEEVDGEDLAAIVGNNFSFASSATSQLVLERIMSQSEMSPLTSGRLSHSSGPLNGGGSPPDSPPVSPSDLEDAKYPRANPRAKQHYTKTGVGTTRTVGRWLKDRRERTKEEARAHNAQLHAAVSVAGVAAAVAAIAAATAAASGDGKDDQAARTDVAVASAAMLVAAQCVEAAEELGAERNHLASVLGSAVSVRTPGDIITLTAAAATALRGAATLKARAMKEVWNVAAVIPVEKGGLGNHHQTHRGKGRFGQSSNHHQTHHQTHRGDNRLRRKSSEANDNDEVAPDENFSGLCSRELLARGSELLKRTRKGSLHWKLVAVYIDGMGQVMLKTKSRHVGGTITKTKKSVIIDVCKEVSAWPGRHPLEGGEQHRYFGLKTAEHRVIEFECRSQREYETWTRGVSRLLSTVNNGERERKGVI